MSYRLRRATVARALMDLINNVVFVMAFSGVALSLFFFAANRFLVARIVILAVSCAVLAYAGHSLTRSEAKRARLPLRLLALAGFVFALFGIGLTVVSVIRGVPVLSSMTDGIWFALFGILAAASSLFAVR